MGNLSIFNLGIFNEEPKGTFPPPPELNGLFVHPVDRPVVDNIFNCSKVMPYLAGGACLAWYQHRPVDSDIDVYFQSKMQFEEFKYDFERCEMFDKHGSYTVKMTTDNALTYGATDRNTGKTWTVQLIKKDFHPTLEAVLDNFDITVCKIGFDGSKVVMRSTFARDEQYRILKFDNVNPHSHKRLVKYMSYGYQPAHHTFEQVCNSDNIDWLAKGTDHYA
jgi:hypothetical protein